MKKMISLMLLLTVLLTANIPVYAAENNGATAYTKQDYSELAEKLSSLAEKPVVSVAKNEFHSDYRYIKVTWKRIKYANGYNIQISTDRYFSDCVVDKLKPANAAYINHSSSANIKENIDSDYYIRVRPVMDVEINGRYYRMYGRWSDAVIAKGE